MPFQLLREMVFYGNLHNRAKCYCNHNISIFLYLSLHYMAQKQLFAVSFYSEYLLHLVNTSMLVEVYANWIMPGYVCSNSMTRS